MRPEEIALLEKLEEVQALEKELCDCEAAWNLTDAAKAKCNRRLIIARAEYRNAESALYQARYRVPVV